MPHHSIRTFVAAAALALSLLPGIGQAKSENSNAGENPGQSNGNGGGAKQTADPVHCAASVVIANPGYLSCLGSFTGNIGAAGHGPLSFGDDQYDLMGATTAGDATGAGPFQSFAADMTGGVLQLDTAWVGTFILALKVGNEHSLYAFKSDDGVHSIGFDTLGVGGNGNGQPGTLAVAAIYGGSELPSAAAVAQVPEPGTPALLLAGLAAIGLLARRRKA